MKLLGTFISLISILTFIKNKGLFIQKLWEEITSVTKNNEPRTIMTRGDFFFYVE
jgi:hypothetical protein